MTKPDPLKRTLRSTSDASWEDEFVPRSALEAAEAERDRLAGRVAELEGERNDWREEGLRRERELETRLQQATEALMEIANWPVDPYGIHGSWRIRAEDALAALAGEDDCEPYRYVRGEALMTERKKKPPDPQREGDYL